MANRSSDTHRSHKRQKSSLTNIGYYIPEQQQQQQQSPEQAHLQQQQHQQPQLQFHPQYQSSPVGSQQSRNVYDYDPYSTLNYNFNSTTAPSSSTGTGANILSNAQSKPIQTSPNRSQSGHPSYFQYNSPTQYPISGSIDQTFGQYQQVPQQIELQSQQSQQYQEAPGMYEQFAYPKTISEFNELPQPQPQLQPLPDTSSRASKNRSSKHNKNLSVASRFNLFNLDASTNTRVANETKPLSTNPIFDEILQGIVNVDGSNVNNYLLRVLEKLNSPFPVDDFYNFLYDNDKQSSYISINPSDKIDRTMTNYNVQDSYFGFFNQLLNIFRVPNSILDYFPNMANRENKLLGINYHELLRTFLAIKVLFDVLIQLPSTEDPQKHTIPRLSIYKTYYIICQKLINQYPSHTNTSNEQQKLILGQSKLGKLLKLVYPNLLIKRLGSRGDSKYNYLGVIWNENIISDEIKKICDENDLSHLNEIFVNKEKAISGQRRRINSLTASSTAPRLRVKMKARSKSEPEIKVNSTYSKSLMKEDIRTPSFSFVKPHLKFPESDNFTILEDKDRNTWFKNMKSKAYDFFLRKDLSFSINEVIKIVFLDNDNLTEKSSLCSGFIDDLIKPLSSEISSSENLDLYLYSLITMELLPYLLFIKTSPQVNYLKNLRLNLLYLVDNFAVELNNMNVDGSFKIENARKFEIIMKKLININDLLITFIKLLNKEDSSNSSIMVQDVKNYLDSSKERNSSFRMNDDNFELNFKHDILSKDLLFALKAYNFDPTINQESKSALSPGFIHEEATLIENFFKYDLLSFLNGTDASQRYESLSLTSPNDETDSILSLKETTKLVSLLELIHNKLLTHNFKSKYPILVYTNFLNLMFNDTLKYIFFKYQKQQHNKEENQSSFGNWWVFNSFVQEYSGFMGEVVGLNDTL